MTTNSRENPSRYMVGKRRAAAEEVCWTLILMMGCGLLDDVPEGERKMLAEPLQAWANLAYETGIMD